MNTNIFESLHRELDLDIKFSLASNFMDFVLSQEKEESAEFVEESFSKFEALVDVYYLAYLAWAKDNTKLITYASKCEDNGVEIQYTLRFISTSNALSYIFISARNRGYTDIAHLIRGLYMYYSVEDSHKQESNFSTAACMAFSNDQEFGNDYQKCVQKNENNAVLNHALTSSPP